MDDLGELREAIAGVDKALLELLRRRMDLAERVGQVKAAKGLPIVVHDVEERVLTRARSHAEACGVSEDVMAGVFAAVIRGAVERQHRVGVELRAQRGRRMLVLGGAGNMGTWFLRFLELGGHRVDAVDPAWAGLGPEPGRYASLAEARALSDYAAIVVATPLRTTPDVLADVVERRPPCPVLEVASIKAHLDPILRDAERQDVRVLCLHPMFGPGKSPYEPLTFVLACRHEDEGERELATELLTHPYTHLVTMPFEHHDRLMGWLLGLAHLSGILFATALARAGLDPEDLQESASTTFARQAATASSVLSEDPELYFDIQQLNPHRRTVYDAVASALDELVVSVEGGDREGFRRALQSGLDAITPRTGSGA